MSVEWFKLVPLSSVQVALAAYQIRHMHSTAMASRLSIISILAQVARIMT